MSMPETAGQRAVRITLFNSGLSPPVFILSNFTDPPWEPHEMSYVEDRRVDKSKPSQRPVEYLFWGRFDIYPGVWLYKYQIGHDNWLIYDHQAEMKKNSSGEEFNVLRVEKTGPAFFESPAALPIPGSGSSSSNPGSLSRQSTREDPLEPSSSNQFPVGDSFSMSPLFSSSPANVAEEGSDPSDNVLSDGEQPLLGHQNAGAIAQSRSHSGSEASVKSKDQEAFLTVCWQNFIAWICILFAKVFGRFSNA